MPCVQKSEWLVAPDGAAGPFNTPPVPPNSTLWVGLMLRSICAPGRSTSLTYRKS